MKRILGLGFVVTALLPGCGKTAPSESTGTIASAGPSKSATIASPLASAVPSASAAPVPTDEPPTERRAERKAATEINRANYKTEFSKIEKELGTSSP